MKLAQESILSSQIENLAIIRLANVFGTGQPIGKGQGVIAEWFAAIEKGTNPVIYGERESYRDYIHILDSVSAIEMVAKSQEIGILNVGSGIATSLEQLKEYFTQIVGLELNFTYDQTRKTDRSGYYLSISKINNSLAWKPKIELKDGIEMIYRDSKGNRE
jgi:UDP-glucose 4-epimerase